MGDRARLIIDIEQTGGGPVFETDVCFHLSTNGDAAGYYLSPDALKEQISAHLDILMRRISKHPLKH